MESTLSSTTLFTLSKTLTSSRNLVVYSLHRRFSQTPNKSIQKRLLSGRIGCMYNGDFQRSSGFVSASPPGTSPRNLLVAAPISSRIACMSNSTALFISGGGGDGSNGGKGGGSGDGDGGSNGGETKSKSIAGGSEEVSALSPDVIILDVGGMTCGGCAASVKRILENQPQVSSANVNLATETAIVWPVAAVKVTQNWQQQLGETLAKHLTNCGFKSKLRDSSRESFFQVFERKMDEKRIHLQESGRNLAVSWALCAVCLFGHLSHFLGANASWMHAFHSTGFHFSLSLFTLLGPGRQLILDGLKSLMRGAPNMNTLVGLGALSSFAVSSIAALIPKLEVAGHFTYGVMALSAATFMFWKFFGTQILPAAFHQGDSLSLALQLSCSVLVIACPCALGLATPTAVLVGTSLGATRGLLLRGGSILEKFALVNTIVFDKTGTLTAGRPIVTKIAIPECEGDKKKNSDHEWSEMEVLRLAAAVESNTIHPIGKAIVEAARLAGCQHVKVVDGTFKEEPGSGAVATIGQKKVSIGTLEWVQRHGVDGNPFKEVEEFKNQSIVYVGIDSSLAGLIYFEDKIREDACYVVESLSKQGKSIYMLSGDKKHTAEYVASVVGISKDKVLSGVKPDEKKKFISELQKNRKIVAMVGDGINDAAALASSDIGVAMGSGVGAASDVSNVVLLGNKLSQLLEAMELSKMTMRTVKQNLWWAFAYNIVGIPIAAGLLLPVTGTILTPSIAGALMGLSSLGVMTNSLLLRLKFASREKPIYKMPLDSKTSPNADLIISQSNKPENPYAAAKWRNV
uniref:HMA domain-containing protein n=1 Tax=Nelumbo nucifera TaxID=4432 RepID=A0A822Z9A0_NELNU|nr:TPA_asm: hypothetical protein HUJ06_015466 [Nelumbo nucifera]